MLSVILISIFLLGMIIIGIWGMRKTSNVGDFFLGGRTIGPWISAFAYGTTYFSAVLFIGFAGKLGWAFGIRVQCGFWITAFLAGAGQENPTDDSEPERYDYA